MTYFTADRQFLQFTLHICLVFSWGYGSRAQGTEYGLAIACYNAMYAGYAWPVLKAAYGVGWPVYGSLLLLLLSTRSGHAQLSFPGFFLLLLCCSQNFTASLQTLCTFAVVALSLARSCQRASTHSVLVVFFLTSSAAHFNAACGPPSVQAAVRPASPSKLSPRAGPGFKPRAGPVPGNAEHWLKPLNHIAGLQKFGVHIRLEIWNFIIE